MNPPASPSPLPEPVPEGDLALTLGVSRPDLKKLRGELEAEKDWTGGQGTPVLILPSGVAKLRVLLEKKGGAGAVIAEAASAALSGAGYETLVVLRIGSPRIVLARVIPAEDRCPSCGDDCWRWLASAQTQICPACGLVATDEGNEARELAARPDAATGETPVPPGAVIRVMVSSSENFVPGMRMERCVRHPQFPDVAYYHGRYPRRKGRF